MIFAIGSKVQLRFTGETGTVTALLGDGMVQVRLDSDWHSLIPTFEEDLVVPGSLPSPAATPRSSAPTARQVIKSSAGSPQPRGIELVFEPLPGKDGQIQYRVWLLNDSSHEFLYDAGLYIESDELMFLEGRLSAWTICEMGTLRANDLNDGPEAELGIRRITTAGTDEELVKILKIKPKHFFKQREIAPVLNSEAYCFNLFEQFDPVKNEQKSADNLAAHTKGLKGRQRQPAPAHSRKYDVYNVEDFAHFEPEIDLHIEVLTNGYARLDKGEILRIQMQHFHRFMDKATRLGVPHVFLIHGVGEGKLKESIAAELRRMPQVRKFKNEFHHKYGYGATEVIFR